MPSIDERYSELHPKSAMLSERAEELFPDGVTHDGRKSGPFRVYMDHGPMPWAAPVTMATWSSSRRESGTLAPPQLRHTPNRVRRV